MRKFFYFLFFILSSCVVLAVSDYPVHTVVYTASDCVGNLSVVLLNSSLVVDSGEFRFNDCDEVGSVWFCLCNDSYVLQLDTQVNTVNSYAFEINYTSWFLVEEHRRRVVVVPPPFVNDTVLSNDSSNLSSNVSVDVIGNVSDVIGGDVIGGVTIINGDLINVFVNDSVVVNVSGVNDSNSSGDVSGEVVSSNWVTNVFNSVISFLRNLIGRWFG